MKCERVGVSNNKLGDPSVVMKEKDRMKASVMFAVAPVLATLLACAAPTDDETNAPTDDVDVSVSTNQGSGVKPQAALQYADCTGRDTGFAYWYSGTRKFGRLPPTAAQCNSWCNDTCGYSAGGHLTAPAYNPGRPPTATCYCN